MPSSTNNSILGIKQKGKILILNGIGLLEESNQEVN